MKKLYVIAGEASGDALGGALLQALGHLGKRPVQVYGVGGEAMTAQGLSSLFPMTDLSLMGLVEILPHLPNLWARRQEVLEDMDRIKPDLLVTIDSPGFCFSIAKKAKERGIPCVHYTAPTVWAWRPGRAFKMAKFLDHVLALFPFEKPYFDEVKLPCTFVGHPLIEKNLATLDPAPLAKKLKWGGQGPLLCVLPGSRRGEITRHLPVFLDTVERLRHHYHDLTIIVPTLPHFRELIENSLMDRAIPAFVVTDPGDKYQAMRLSTAALAASGTVTLELGLCQTPMVVGYKTNPLTAAIVRHMLTVRYVSLVNILCDAAVVPECLQEDFTADTLFKSLQPLLETTSPQSHDQKHYFERLPDMLTSDLGQPSLAAAQVVARLLLQS